MSAVNIINVHNEAWKYISEYCNKNGNLFYLDVGGGNGRGKVTKAARASFDLVYHNLEMQHDVDKPEFIKGDICHCPEILDETYDIVYSHNAFEHFEQPWLAAEECVRVCKVGGLNVHITNFAWHYHPDPEDYFRFTHKGLMVLFRDLKCLMTGYDFSRRGKWVNTHDWTDHCLVLYIGQRVE